LPPGGQAVSFKRVSLIELKETIQKLSVEERAELNRVLYGWEDDEWDQQMADDVASGRLDEAIKRAEADMAHGRCREL
jgi:hypothetical protein